MEQFVRITGENLPHYLKQYQVLVCSLRRSRRKAKKLAIWELFFALSPIGGIFITNGPLGEIGGQISFFVQSSSSQLVEILKGIGFCESFYLLDFSSSQKGRNEFRWKGYPFTVAPFYKQEKAVYNSQSSHNRIFYIYDDSMRVKEVIGYRGDGSEMGRRALPVEDSRLLVQLGNLSKRDTLLDPFAGSGGVLVSARYLHPHLHLLSGDIDPVLSPGLTHYSNQHVGVDAREYPIGTRLIDAIVTEVPFSSEATAAIGEAFVHLADALSSNGRLSFMCSNEQYPILEKVLRSISLFPLFALPLLRQGSQVMVALWYKEEAEARRLASIAEVIQNIR